ncbi:hypothetical protein ACIGAN_01535 [Streptomyces sp. NPDC085931]|uniref:hypothetical protein n=1 Tax=Streptomyces sp. NPDC085931 TaxID=3365740 RepID=UPI0037D91AFF
MSDGTAVPPAPRGIAPRGDGPRAAVTVAVVDLHLRGLTEADPPGDAGPGRRGRRGGPRPLPPPAEAVHTRVRKPAGLKTLMEDPGIRLAVALTRVPLADAGLPRHPLLGPRWAARRSGALAPRHGRRGRGLLLLRRRGRGVSGASAHA